MARRLRAVKSDPLGQAIGKMTEEHLACRDYGHAWFAVWATYDQPAQCFQTAARCARCMTVRERWLDPDGSRLGSRYTYPEDYLAKGVGRLHTADRARLRLAHIETLLASHPKAAEQ